MKGDCERKISERNNSEIKYRGRNTSDEWGTGTDRDEEYSSWKEGMDNLCVDLDMALKTHWA